MSVRAIPFPKIEAVTFRPLRADEYEKLKPLLDKQGWTLPYPEMTAVIVAEYGGQIVGFGITQLVPIASPMWVDSEWRGHFLAEKIGAKLVETMEAANLPYWMVVAPNEVVAKFFRRSGLREKVGTLFAKE